MPHDLFKRSFDEFSPCGRARFAMGHIWDADKPSLLSVALNPSVGAAAKNDPTNTRLENRAVQLGLGGVIYTNLFPLVATSPKDMLRADDPYIDPERADSVILEYAADAFVLCGWGAHGTHRNRDREVIDLLAGAGHKLHALGLTKDGHPRHPLYMPYSAKPFAYEPEARHAA